MFFMIIIFFIHFIVMCTRLSIVKEIRNYYTMGNFYLQYQYTLPVISDKALPLK